MSNPFIQGIDDHIQLTEWLRTQAPKLEEIGEVICRVLAHGNRIYLIGNGGSAADAQHIAAELVGRFKRERRALPAIALTTDTSALLSIGNDYGFDSIFRRQVEALIQPGDVIWALSTSGESRNIIEAVCVARHREALVIGFTGQDGGDLKPLCDYCLCVDHKSCDRIQEMHQLAYHLVCDYLECYFSQE